MAAGLLSAFAACTLILDRNATQCQTNADCAAFGSNVVCQNAVCVPPVPGPPGCTLPPKVDYPNQCTSSMCLGFDNCAHSICDAIDADVVTPPRPDAGAPTPGGSVDAGGAADLPSCEQVTQGRSQVVYVTGSSNVPPLFRKLAPVLKGVGLALVFQITNSCTGVGSIFSENDGDHYMYDPGRGATQYATYFPDDGSPEIKCTMGVGHRIDIGESDIFSTTCPPFGKPGSAIREIFGPVQAMAFVVPGTSSQTAISAEVAFNVFGRGAALPWNDPVYFYVRNKGTGTQQMIARAIGVPADGFWGLDRGTASNLATQMTLLSGSPMAENAIGIISVDSYDANRIALRALAFRAYGQSCAYLPDSSPLTTDKQNVRDGHYPIWGPMHFFAEVKEGDLFSQAAETFLAAIAIPDQGTAGKDLLSAFIGASLIPNCAMRVKRDEELGTLSAYAPPGQCHCYFDSHTGTAPAECKICQGNEDCPASRPYCWYGFCEEK